jgi:aminoglycoside 3-N-acetyltransferase I
MMRSAIPFTVRKLTPHDLDQMEAMMTVFGQAFDELDTYTKARPSRGYMAQLLGSANFIALAALRDETVVGGLGAYELQKFEQERSEIYVYDLAVAAAHRRQGIASALIEELNKIAAARGAYVIFVQADLGDDPAIALYSKLGTRDDVLQFDIKVGAR